MNHVGLETFQRTTQFPAEAVQKRPVRTPRRVCQDGFGIPGFRPVVPRDFPGKAHVLDPGGFVRVERHDPHPAPAVEFIHQVGEILDAMGEDERELR